MGLACPVCETPQRDAEHLANHLAFTAMLHGDAHERWLDETVPGWAGEGAAELGPVVAEHAEEAVYEEVFEESVPDDHDHAHDRPVPTGDTPTVVTDDLDDDTRRTLTEAREMTRAMLDGETDGAPTDGGPDDADGDDHDDADGKA
ncbi:DUF5810 domain-containing protein [Haloplanus pelagicus]|jgi:hypothetical protein|uniref:DUF5810 domain-containing protein n=1 Tax=Haloplanus pelagicus TaxID=2949995 RepID=UPI0020417972|nr:DUF5810 domain-containing protein [Haloplanus sp. HW8-1]